MTTAGPIMKKRFLRLPCPWSLVLVVLYGLAIRHGQSAAANAGGVMVDTLSFGDAPSEKAHPLTADPSDVIPGGLGESARRLLPLNKPSWEGGKMAFTMKVDPDHLNYVTVRLWGSDVSSNRMLLFCEGKQIGYRHLGDIDSLDIGSDAPFCNGRFFYNTSPLPIAMTRGKAEVQLEIRSNGPIWGYGRNWEEYQKTMTQPTRGLYRVYTHTDGAFMPPAGEKQGLALATAPVRQSPGPEVLELVKQRIVHEVDGRLRAKGSPNQMQMQFLARAYFVKWTVAYENAKVLEQVVAGLDADYRALARDPKFAQSDPATPNPSWFGLGPSGQALSLLRDPLKSRLDEKIDDGAGTQVARREAYSRMLCACRDWHRKNRRQYTNQSMINDLYGIYWANRGVAAVDPAKAMPEEECRRYLYESLGMTPWLGSDTDAGPSKPLGDHFVQFTAKGLSRELGYVGYYGEVLDWATQIYNATRPTPTAPGDEKIRERIATIARARTPFRYPSLDAEGNRAIRVETVVGWRDVHYPGDVTYAQRPSWDGSPVEIAAATLDPLIVGSVQEMFDDNQFFATLQEHMKDGGFRVTGGLLGVIDDYAAIHAQPPSTQRLPMSRGVADYVFADEEDGVVAIKHGDDILYASLYWRARYAINNLARVHAITPTYERIATVHEVEQFEPSGLTYIRPNWVNLGFGNGGLRYPGDLQSAHVGAKLPVARIPDGVSFKPGQENMYAGRALFYELRYGKYLIGMNASSEKTYTLIVPTDAAARELPSGKIVPFGKSIDVKPLSTTVLILGE